MFDEIDGNAIRMIMFSIDNHLFDSPLVLYLLCHLTIRITHYLYIINKNSEIKIFTRKKNDKYPKICNQFLKKDDRKAIN